MKVKVREDSPCPGEVDLGWLILSFIGFILIFPFVVFSVLFMMPFDEVKYKKKRIREYGNL